MGGDTNTIYMILTNPTDSTVSIQIDGKVYSVEPMGVVTVSDSVGAKWVKTHGFLQAMPSEVTAAVATVVETEEAPEIEEEVEEVEEAPSDEPTSFAQRILGKKK